jgi:hypothetical protein
LNIWFHGVILSNKNIDSRPISAFTRPDPIVFRFPYLSRSFSLPIYPVFVPQVKYENENGRGIFPTVPDRFHPYLKWWWLGVLIAPTIKPTVGEAVCRWAHRTVRCASHVTQPLGFWRFRPLELWHLGAPDSPVSHRTGTVHCPVRRLALLWLCVNCLRTVRVAGDRCAS